MKKAEALSERLAVAKTPKLLPAEVVAANLYTGPVRTRPPRTPNLPSSKPPPCAPSISIAT